MMHFTSVLAVVSAMCLFGCGSSFTVYKVGSVEVLGLKDVNDVYPTFAASTKFELDLALETKGEIVGANLGTKWEEDVVQLYEELDQINYQLRTQLVSAYSGFLTSLSVATTAEERAAAVSQWNQHLTIAAAAAQRVREINAQIGRVRVSSSATEIEELIRMTGEVEQFVETELSPAAE